MKVLKLVIVCLCASLVGGSAAAGSPGHHAPLDDAEDCLDAVPEQHSITGTTDDGRESILNVHTLLDGVTPEHGNAAMEAAARPYAEIAVKLVPTFEAVSFPASGATPEGTPTIDPYELFQLAKAHTGGYRPHGSDVVYVMTNKELVSGGALGGAVAGQADCIGGVRYPNRAFAVGETSPDDWASDNWYGSIIAGHEIAHLLGAHHHYANCAQGDPEDVVEYWTPCTLMFNDLSFISRRFSTVEAAAVRGHVLAFADSTTQGPPELAPREVRLRLKSGVARGEIGTMDEVEMCKSEVEVRLQRSRKRNWVDVAATMTSPTGFFEVGVGRNPGEYRAYVPESMAHDGTSWRTCESAVSGVVTVPRKRG